MRGATASEKRFTSALRYFNPRAPCGARPAMRGTTGRRLSISIHAPHAGRDGIGKEIYFRTPVFQSTRPMRGATSIVRYVHSVGSEFQSTRPMRGATGATDPIVLELVFQSTRPMRGATVPIQAFEAGPDDFNPRAPCGARRDEALIVACLHNISIHAPHAGRDRPACPRSTGIARDFNPRAPCGARREKHESDSSQRTISIHAPHAGRDCRGLCPGTTHPYFNPRAPCGARLCPAAPCGRHAAHFNPRAPCGARPLKADLLRMTREFQSTRPMRGATGKARGSCRHLFQFQSTRPMRGATIVAPNSCTAAMHFNPRAPCGARLPAAVADLQADGISIHAPHAGRDAQAGAVVAVEQRQFQSTRPMRGATAKVNKLLCTFL